MSYDTQASPILATLEQSAPPPMPTFSPYRSPALVLALWEKVRVLKTQIAGCGLRRKELFAWVDLNTLSLKTAQLSLYEDLTGSSFSLPKSGMMQNGHIYRATSSVSNSAEKDFFLLPTPLKADARALCGRNQYFGNLKPKHGYTLPPFIRDGPEDGIYPNPELTEVLMTFPAGYTDLSAQVTRSYP